MYIVTCLSDERTRTARENMPLIRTCGTAGANRGRGKRDRGSPDKKELSINGINYQR